MNGRDFLEVAKNLSRSQFEASLRSAISRAYYGLFNAAAQLLRELGFAVEHGPGAHGQVYHRLFNSGIERSIDFARIIDELRTQRNEADYNMQSLNFQNQAACSLRVAKAEIPNGLLADFNKEALRSQIRTGIREYEGKIGLHA